MGRSSDGSGTRLGDNLRRILLILALIAASCMAAALYFDVSPDSHFVVTDRNGDTLWKSPDVSAGAIDSLFPGLDILGSAWLQAGDTIHLDTAATRTWLASYFLGISAKAADASGADSADVGVVSRSCTGNASTASNAALLQGQDTTALWNAKTLRGRDTTDFDNAKLLQGKDTTALYAAKTAVKIASDGDSAKVWTMTSPSTQGWLAAAGGGGGGDTIWTTPQTLTETGRHITMDLSLGGDMTVTLTGNDTLYNPTNVVNGKRVSLRVWQDGTGTRTLVMNSNHRTAGSVPFTLTATALKGDWFVGVCRNDSIIDWSPMGFSYTP